MPVCDRCFAKVSPFAAECSCSCCHTPFLNDFPLDEQGRCALCRLGLSGYDEAYCYGSHDGVLRSLIHLFKYDGIRTLAGPLGNLMLAAMPRDRSWDVVVPMPLHWWRRWRRGYNQSEILARALARRIGIPMRKTVRRVKATPPQAGMSRAERRRNVTGAFSIRRCQQVAGLRVLLIDDVLTSGATARACAMTLKQAGATHVTVLTLSRADRRHPAPAGQDTAPPVSTVVGDSANV